MSEKLLVLGQEGNGSEFLLTSSPITLGAGADCDIRLTGTTVGEAHAVLEKGGAGWHLRSLDASRPIESEGRVLTEMRLDHGTVFRLGDCRLRFVTPKAIIEAAGPAAKPFENQEEAISELREARDCILQEVGKIIVGQKKVLTQILTALFARGHCLLIGVPGLAKTLMVRTLAVTLHLDAKRIQFTPDLMPADITGTDILEEDTATGHRSFRFSRGPLFTNMLLADEINRTPPKTQAALLEAMQ